MMKKIKNYLLEDCGKTRAYDLYTTGALIAYMAANIYLSYKLDKVRDQKMKLERELEYKDFSIEAHKVLIDSDRKIIEDLTDKLEKEKEK